MKIFLSRIAAVLAVIIGGMAVFAGAKVLMGNDPGYYVIDWLPVYNYTLGVLTVSVTAPLIWLEHRYAKAAAIGTLFLHGLVMVLLQTGYQAVVAPDSIRAMTIRISAWAIIFVLMAFTKPEMSSAPQ